MPQVCLYAELLIHIRQLTLHAALQTVKNENTKILLSSDKKVITALHEGEAASIYLPTQISGTANITFPLKKTTDLSTKLEIEDQYQLDQAIEAASGVEVPWTASGFGKHVSLSCKQCKSGIIEAGAIEEWKDLPSENWAELMDMWFCHKPNVNHEEDTTAAEAKGFSAKSKLHIARRVGYVDVLSFLVHLDDCSGLKASNHDQATVETLTCSQCDSFIGSAKAEEDGYRIWKSKISLVRDSHSDPEIYDSSIFIAAQLLHLIETSVGRRVVVHSNTGSGLLCWIFNPDIYYSSSKRGPTVHRAMKVFYKEIEDPIKLLDEHSSTVEELALPEQEVTELGQTLVDSAQILPQSARTFQEWQVGLLDRYEEHPSGRGAMDQNALNHKAPDDMEMFKLPEGWSELYV